jgi:hypothetical protein
VSECEEGDKQPLLLHLFWKETHAALSTLDSVKRCTDMNDCGALCQPSCGSNVICQLDAPRQCNITKMAVNIGLLESYDNSSALEENSSLTSNCKLHL